jgi:stage V sporulation protein G
MEITEVKVFPIQEEKLKAFVSIVFDHCFMVNDIKIIQGREGLFISMPSRKKKNGEFKDVAHPLNNETRRMIETQILAEYDRVVGGEPSAVPIHAADRTDRVEAFDRSDRSGASDRGEPAAAPVHFPASPPPAAAPLAAPVPAAEKTLEEVEEMHLRDSFWTVT